MISSIAIYCLHTVKWFQVLLSNTNSPIWTQLNGHKYRKWLTISIWPINGNLTGTTNPDQSGPGSNGNEGLLHIPQSSKAGAMPSDGLMS